MNRFGHVIFYVENVEKTIEFFEKAFGFKRRFIDPTSRYGELATGQTALGFASFELAGANLPGGYRKIDPNGLPQACEVAITSSDPEAAIAQALKEGATLLADLEMKDWGQSIGYVRDPNGILIEIASEIQGCPLNDELLCCDHCD